MNMDETRVVGEAGREIRMTQRVKAPSPPGFRESQGNSERVLAGHVGDGAEDHVLLFGSNMSDSCQG
jgi:hypothetical protein